MRERHPLPAAAAVLLFALGAAAPARAQTSGDDSPAPFGTYEPNTGFKVASTDKGELSLRIYTYIRYLNQTGLDDTYTDSFGKRAPSTSGRTSSSRR